MGIIQSAVNQVIGTAGAMAGIGKVIKTGQESVDLQKKAADEATAEREKKKAYAAQIEEEIKNDPSLQPTTHMMQVGEDEFEVESAVDPNERGIYLQNQLANVYEESGQFGQAFEMRRKAKLDQYVLDAMIKNNSMKKNMQLANIQANLQAQDRVSLKADQAQQSKEFEKKFLEDVNTMKGVRSVTTFGADTGEPNLRKRTVYTPGREEVK